MYLLIISPRAQKELRKIKKIYQRSIKLAIEEIKEDPFLGKPLTRDLIGKYACKVGGYRIIYKVNKTDKVINILSAGHRSKIYD